MGLINLIQTNVVKIYLNRNNQKEIFQFFRLREVLLS